MADRHRSGVCPFGETENAVPIVDASFFVACFTGVCNTLFVPTPFFTFRLSSVSQDALRQVARLMASDSSKLAREIIETALSGDPKRIEAFNRRLALKVGEQLELRFNNAQKRAPAARKPAYRGRKASGGTKGRVRRNERSKR